MCLGGMLFCPDCPANQWYHQAHSIAPPTVHSADWPTPLLGAHGSVKVMDTAAEYTILQRFENKEKQPLEVEYRFKLDATRAAVTKFVAFIDDKKVKGIIKDKEEARNVYDDALASGHGAYLLEQTSEKLFTVSIGNLPPGKEVLISLTYVTEVEFNDAGQLRLILPEQKFAPNGVDSKTFPAPTTQDHNRFEKQVPAGLTLDISFEMTSKITQIISETHPKAVIGEIDAANPHRGTARMATTPQPLVEDCEILVQLEDPSKLVALVQKNEKGEKLAMVSFFPRLADVEPMGEIVFLVDRSGSMAGGKMKRTQDTMQIFLRSLSPGIRFNIISFGSTYRMLFPRSVDYDEASLASATELVGKMSANMGGTEILVVLKAIFAQSPDPKYPRQLFILTDGEVSNPEDCIRECKKAAENTRVFCFGIGAGASKQLVEGMAKAAAGDYEMVQDQDRIDDKVLRQLGRALSPAVSDIKIAWPPGASRVAPFRQLPVFGGERVTSFAWLKPDQGKFSVSLTATTPKGDVFLMENVDPAQAPQGETLFGLAALRLFRDFEERRSYAHTTTGAMVNGFTEAKIKEEMVQLSKETGVMCKHTAFVAVEERNGEVVQKEMVIRRITQEKSRQGGAANLLTLAPAYPGGTVTQHAWNPPPAPPQLNYMDFDGYGAPQQPSAVFGFAAAGPGAGYPAPQPGSGGVIPLSSSPYASQQQQQQSQFADLLFFGGAPPPVPTASMPFQGRYPAPQAGSYGMPPPPPPAGAAPPPLSNYLLDNLAPAPAMEAKRSRNAMLDEEFGAAELVKAPLSAKLTEAELNRMRQTIQKLSAVGSWSAADAAGLTHKSVSDLEAALPAQFKSGPQHEVALLLLATAIVCVYFEGKFAQEKVTWQLVVKKARTWMKKQGLTEVDWEAVARRFVN